MATYRNERESVTDDDDDSRLRVALRWATLYAWCDRHPDHDTWHGGEMHEPGAYRLLTDHWLSRVSEIVGHKVDDNEAARLWSLHTRAPTHHQQRNQP